MYKFPTGKKTVLSETYDPMSQTIQTRRTKLPPLSAMGDYEGLHVEEQARSHSVMGQQKADAMGDDPFYKNALEGYQP
jgi:hypothetical protein